LFVRVPIAVGVAALLSPPSPHKEDYNFFFRPLKSAIRRAAVAAAALLIAAQGSTEITIDLCELAHTVALDVLLKFLEIHPIEPRGAFWGFVR
jgi:hypothetical protein